MGETMAMRFFFFKNDKARYDRVKWRLNK